MRAIGATDWVIPEGYLPVESQKHSPQTTSHETACILNTFDHDAHVQITILFSDRDPVGPYRVTVPGRRTTHVHFKDLKDPAPIPRGIDYASVLESDVPVVVQHTRLDSRQERSSLIIMFAYPFSEPVMAGPLR
jgi:hypothetical protein